MKKSVIKRVLCFVFALSLLGGFAFSASAETIQDRIHGKPRETITIITTVIQVIIHRAPQPAA